MRSSSGGVSCATGETLRVLHLVHSFSTGGAERVVLDLVHHASSSVGNFVCSLQQPSDLAGQLDRERAGFCCLDKQEGNDPRVIAGVGRLIDEECIDVVHAQGWGTFVEGLLAAKWRSARRPAFIHAFHGKTIEDLKGGVPMRRRIAQRIAHHWTDACIAPAQHMAEQYARSVGLGWDRIELIPNGIDTTRFGRSLYPGARAALGLGAEEFVVGFVGRLDPVKNLAGIVEVFHRFLHLAGGRGAELRLLMVGDGSARAETERLVAARGLTGSVLFAGLRSDVPQCLAALDAYLQPSLYEGLSITILEALATGLPVLSSAVGGTSEIIAHGQEGLLHSPDDHETLARSLARLYWEPEFAASLGRRGRQRVEAHFSVRAMVERYEDLYRRIVKPGERSCVA